MRACRALLCLVLLTMPVVIVAQQPQPPAATEGFEPLSQVPPSEQIPAFRLVAIAYSFVWVVLIGYVWSVSRRLQNVEQELAELEQRRP